MSTSQYCIAFMYYWGQVVEIGKKIFSTIFFILKKKNF
jgi:hypothetical protein